MLPFGRPTSTRDGSRDARILIHERVKTMAGSHTLRLRSGRFTAVLALSCVTFVGRAQAQNPSPPLPPAGVPASSFADVVGSVPMPEATPAAMTVPGTTYYPGYEPAPTT